MDLSHLMGPLLITGRVAVLRSNGEAGIGGRPPIRYYQKAVFCGTWTAFNCAGSLSGSRRRAHLHLFASSCRQSRRLQDPRQLAVKPPPACRRPLARARADPAGVHASAAPSSATSATSPRVDAAGRLGPLRQPRTGCALPPTAPWQHPSRRRICASATGWEYTRQSFLSELLVPVARGVRRLNGFICATMCAIPAVE